MAKLTETPQWEDGVYQIETSDPVVGGPDGIANRQGRELANRTAYLKEKVEAADKALADHIASRNHPDGTLTEKGFLQLSSAVNSDSETLAATPKAVKTVNDKVEKVKTDMGGLIKTLPVASLSTQGIVQLSSAVNSDSETLAATPKAVKTAYDLAQRAAGKTFAVADGSLTQKGVVQLSNAVDSESDAYAATPKALKTLSDQLKTLISNLSAADSGALLKALNGSDIPDKAAFIRNLGIRDGAPGPAGPQGPRGLTGATGATGPAGPRGEGLADTWSKSFTDIFRRRDKNELKLLYYEYKYNGDNECKGWWRNTDTGLILQWGFWENTRGVRDDRYINSEDLYNIYKYNSNGWYNPHWHGINDRSNLSAEFVIPFPGLCCVVVPVVRDLLRTKSVRIHLGTWNSSGFDFGLEQIYEVRQDVRINWFAIGF